MDILHDKQVHIDCFGIMASDSDYTRLALRLKEAGKRVYGFDRNNTPKAFMNACNKFIDVETLVQTAPGANTPSLTTITIPDFDRLVAEAIRKNKSPVTISDIGSYLVGQGHKKIYQALGYTSLSKLLQSRPGIKIKKSNVTLLENSKDKQA